jgi:hypothetical protein
MSTNEIKVLLHESIENIDDQQFLIAIKQIIDRKYTSAKNPLLAEWQLNRMDESKAQIEKGQFISNTQADQLVERWLNE